MFGGKRIFFGDTGRIVVDFSVILIHISREMNKVEQTICVATQEELSLIFLSF
jgi:hypothetical protein